MTATYADDADGRRFVERHGFELAMRTRLGVVDPRNLDAGVRAELVRAATNAVRAGFRIQSMPELAARNPDIGLALARLHAVVYRDGHAWDPPAAIDDENAAALFMNDAELIPAALFVATIDGVPAAVGSLRRAESSGELELGWVGATRRHRAHVADLTLGLLARCLDFAAERRAPVRIEIDEGDGPLWMAMAKMPFADDPDWLTLVRT